MMIFIDNLSAQNDSGLVIYSNLNPHSHIVYGQKNDQGFKFVLRSRVQLGDTVVEPGLLLQIDHKGNKLYLDTLRPFAYQFAHTVDSVMFLGAFHYNKILKDSMTYIFEICHLDGTIIKEFHQDFVINVASGTGVAPLNDSILVFTQMCQIPLDEPTVVHYIVNTRTLDVRKKLLLKGGILGNIIKINDTPNYLEWTVDLWLKDTTFTHTTTVNTDTAKADSYGTILPREDKPGWFGFGGCRTPSNYDGICLIVLDDNLKVDKVDLLYHYPSDNNEYFALWKQAICKSGNGYFASGVWNAISPSNYFLNDTFPTNMVIAKYDLQLNRLWTRIIGGDRRYLPYEIHPSDQGGFMLAGGLRDNLNNYVIAPFTMFFDEDGELVGTEEVHAPDRYAFTIYGNPGREALRIMAETGGRKVLLQVVNAMGQPRLHRHLVDGMNEFDTSWWPSGTYLMSITDEQGQVLWSQPWVRE